MDSNDEGEIFNFNNPYGQNRKETKKSTDQPKAKEQPPPKKPPKLNPKEKVKPPTKAKTPSKGKGVKGVKKQGKLKFKIKANVV